MLFSPTYTYVDKRLKDGRFEYFLKWKGYSDLDNTWEPIEHFESDAMKAMIVEYEKSQNKDENSTDSKMTNTSARYTHSLIFSDLERIKEHFEQSWVKGSGDYSFENQRFRYVVWSLGNAYSKCGNEVETIKFCSILVDSMISYIKTPRSKDNPNQNQAATKNLFEIQGKMLDAANTKNWKSKLSLGFNLKMSEFISLSSEFWLDRDPDYLSIFVISHLLTGVHFFRMKNYSLATKHWNYIFSTIHNDRWSKLQTEYTELKNYIKVGKTIIVKMKESKHAERIKKNSRFTNLYFRSNKHWVNDDLNSYMDTDQMIFNKIEKSIEIECQRRAYLKQIKVLSVELEGQFKKTTDMGKILEKAKKLTGVCEAKQLHDEICLEIQQSNDSIKEIEDRLCLNIRCTFCNDEFHRNEYLDHCRDHLFEYKIKLNCKNKFPDVAT